jgi:hypothetical protein
VRLGRVPGTRGPARAFDADGGKSAAGGIEVDGIVGAEDDIVGTVQFLALPV